MRNVHSNYARLVVNSLVVGKLRSADMPMKEFSIVGKKSASKNGLTKSVTMEVSSEERCDVARK